MLWRFSFSLLLVLLLFSLLFFLSLLLLCILFILPTHFFSHHLIHEWVKIFMQWGIPTTVMIFLMAMINVITTKRILSAIVAFIALFSLMVVVITILYTIRTVVLFIIFVIVILMRVECPVVWTLHILISLIIVKDKFIVKGVKVEICIIVMMIHILTSWRGRVLWRIIIIVIMVWWIISRGGGMGLWWGQRLSRFVKLTNRTVGVINLYHLCIGMSGTLCLLLLIIIVQRRSVTTIIYFIIVATISLNYCSCCWWWWWWWCIEFGSYHVWVMLFGQINITLFDIRISTVMTNAQNFIGLMYVLYTRYGRTITHTAL